ncbi:MAG: Holliday junction branch migration protein RuvA [Acholeplasmataceae bacterium]|nr:Holliday junction branch migration protein RuvA [Acholeplasmataceae bacterium]
MYAFIKGVCTLVKPSYIVIESHGVGYLILSPTPYDYKVGSEVLCYTHHYIREDTNALYGFKSIESKELFVRLISVSGIGPKSALSILANDRIDEIILAIEASDVKYLTKFPGIGPKSAQQIILDLKGKLVTDDLELLPSHESDVSQALSALGYSKVEIKKVMKKIDLDLTVEQMIREALKLLMK